MLRAAAILLLASGVLALWAWRQGAQRRAISDLPTDKRAELYRSELDAFRSLCGQGPRTDALERRCREKAEFLLQFPECDQGCEQLARTHLPLGRR
jgi:hypothetical protein